MAPDRSRLPIALALAVGLAFSFACNRKSDAAVQAEQAAKDAQTKVAQLEQQLADAKAGKSAASDGETAKEMSRGHIKALEREVSDAKKRARAAQQEAAQLESSPAPKEAAKPLAVDVPTGTKLEVTLARDLATDKDQAGDPWNGTLASDVVVNGQLVWSAGTAVRGVVTQSVPAGRLSSGKGALSIKVTEVGGVGLDTDTHVMVGEARGTRNAKIIGGGAALGALIGILSDRNNKNDHALGGAAIGAAAGTAVAAGTADTIIRIPAASPLAFTLTAPEHVVIRK
ncbi:MAG TPA: hypothetical protein VF768_02515 [Holophagaceae bacterium]